MNKKVELVLVLSMALAQFSYAQVVFESDPKEKKTSTVKIAFQTAIGFIDPEDVNAYIRYYIDQQTGNGVYLSYGGSSSISLQGTVNLSVVVPVSPKIQIKLPLEYGGASKSVSIDSENEHFSMNRFSTGAIVNYYIPAQSDQAVLLGGGVLYHFMGFEEYRAHSSGLRLEFGYVIFGFKTDFEILMLVDIANGKVKTPSDTFQSLNFSGPSFGVRMIF